MNGPVGAPCELGANFTSYICTAWKWYQDLRCIVPVLYGAVKTTLLYLRTNRASPSKNGAPAVALLRVINCGVHMKRAM